MQKDIKVSAIKTSIVILRYKVSIHICCVIKKIGSKIDTVFVINDCYPEKELRL